MILTREIPERLRRELVETFSKTARVLSDSGIRIVFPESIRARQTAWPEDCPLSEPELRAEVQAIVDDPAALEDEEGLSERAQELYSRLPQPPIAESEREQWLEIS